MPVVAIFDIGKTNKKFFCFDENYQIVLERSKQFEEIVDEDGDTCENISALSEWVIKTLDDVLEIKKLHIKAINFSTYGASFVYINKEGTVIAPLYNYLKTYPSNLQHSFYLKYGGEALISCETASPVLGNLNAGMQLYRIKQEKQFIFESLEYALHLPQFIQFLITKKACSDITSIGCHTQLWDFTKNQYHSWVEQEQLINKLAPIVATNQTTTIEYKNKSIQVGTGLHDSSAALIPYLAVFNEPFVLISTGTWCITLNPFNHIPLTPEELQLDCLCYMTYQGKPVKASRLFAGYEHEQQIKHLAHHFKKPVDFYKKVKYDDDIAKKLKSNMHFSSETQKASLKQSAFANRDLNSFGSYEVAYHCLIADIMQQQLFSTNLVIKNTNVKRIFVDGGFSKNTIYMHMLSEAFPDIEVFAASVAQATAIGAALAIHTEWNEKNIPSNLIDLKFYAQLASM